jgi:CRISPR-associated endoribonuclease Cas6
MLYALVATVIVEQVAELEPSSGHLAHALFLDLMRQADPALAATLHAPSTHKPFTVSPLLAPHDDHPLSGVVGPGQRGRLRFTILDDRVFAALLRKFQHDPVTAVRIGSARLMVADLSTVPGRWTGASSLTQLWDEAATGPSVCLQLASPTSFSLGHANGEARLGLFPLPSLVFGSLSRRWASLESVPLPPSLKELIAQGLVEASYEVRTVALHLTGRPEIGAVGWCRYTARGAWPADALRALNALADFAFYAGVGRKTTMGMGQARRLPGPPSPA